jgi:putative hydrolase of the HAD superfamily
MRAARSILLFDLGGVLIESVHFEELRRLMLSSLSDQELRNIWMRSPAVRAFEGGKVSAAEFGQTITKEFGISVSADDFIAQFKTWPKGFYAGAQALVEHLRQSYRVGCLSNSNSLHWGSHIESVFDFAYSSHLTGFMKPDATAFEHVVRGQGVRAEEICFFDDSVINIDAARKVGMEAHNTVGFQGLIEVLEKQLNFDLPPNHRIQTDARKNGARD